MGFVTYPSHDVIGFVELNPNALSLGESRYYSDEIQ